MRNAMVLAALLLVVSLFYTSQSLSWFAVTAQGNVQALVSPSCNSSLTVHGKLVSDLTCHGTALKIYTDNVTLDCQGHSVGTNRTGIAIHIIGKNVNITNCNFGKATIALYMDPDNVIIENSTFYDSDYGIVIENSRNVTIRNSTIRNNSIAGVLINNTNASTIVNNRFENNYIGIYNFSGIGNTILPNTFTGSILADIWPRLPTPTPTHPSGGAGGVGGLPSCAETWTCAQWSACTLQGVQSRDCTDVSSCAERLANGTVSRIIATALPEKSQSCSYIPECFNGRKDARETDIDCGGICAPCELNKRCAADSDCTIGICYNNVCTPSTCYDGVQSPGETGIDCGGPCPACAAPGAPAPPYIIDTPLGRFYLPGGGSTVIFLATIAIILVFAVYLLYRRRRARHRPRRR